MTVQFTEQEQKQIIASLDASLLPTGFIVSHVWKCLGVRGHPIALCIKENKFRGRIYSGTRRYYPSVAQAYEAALKEVWRIVNNREKLAARKKNSK